MDAVNGLVLAPFSRRSLGFAIDCLLIVLLWVPVVLAWQRFVTHHLHGQTRLAVSFHVHDEQSVVLLLVYFSLLTFWGNGQTPGKWVARTRVVSLTHSRMGLWQSAERALGYGASMLEGGFGFVQFFMHPNYQCVHDRIAETIVVDVRKKAVRATGQSGEHAQP